KRHIGHQPVAHRLGQMSAALLGQYLLRRLPAPGPAAWLARLKVEEPAHSFTLHLSGPKANGQARARLQLTHVPIDGPGGVDVLEEEVLLEGYRVNAAEQVGKVL